MKNITLEMLLDRKLKSENDKMKVVLFKSKVLDGTIEVVKCKARDILKMTDDVQDNAESGLRSNLKLIYKHCPIFHDKELQEVYNVAEPYDVVLEVFDQNIGEINRLAETILGLYGIGSEVAENTKDELKN